MANSKNTSSNHKFIRDDWYVEGVKSSSDKFIDLQTFQNYQEIQEKSQKKQGKLLRDTIESFIDTIYGSKDEQTGKWKKGIIQENKELSEKIAEQSKNITEMEEKRLAQVESMDDMKKEYDSKIENSKLTIIETLGIFVALFTFISVDFQVFRSYRDIYAISGLTLILLGSISFLLLIFDFYILQSRAINNNVEKKYEEQNILQGLWCRLKNHPTRGIILCFIILFIGVGLALFHFADNDDLSDMKNSLQNEIRELVEKKFELRNGIVRAEENNLKNDVVEVNNNLDSIKKCVQNFGVVDKCFR